MNDAVAFGAAKATPPDLRDIWLAPFDSPFDSRDSASRVPLAQDKPADQTRELVPEVILAARPFASPVPPETSKTAPVEEEHS